MLALAHLQQRAIDEGAVADRAVVTRKLGLTRSRVTQLLDLLLLAPDLEETVPELEAIDGVELATERRPRELAHSVDLSLQRAAAFAFLPGLATLTSRQR